MRGPVASPCYPRRRAAREGGPVARRIGRGWRWTALRSRVLDANPLCVLCEAQGRTVAAQEVDHIVPLKDGGTDAWENLRGLCIPCHRKVTAEQARPDQRTRDGLVVGCDAEGRPLAWGLPPVGPK